MAQTGIDARLRDAPRRMTRFTAFFAAAAALLGLAAAGFFAFGRGAVDAFADCRETTAISGAAAIGGPFSLTDGAGARVTDGDVITGPTLVYFGYTFCPDFCPMDLARNAIAADMLAEQGVDVAQVFVTIDPARDTPAVVRDFAASIHPDLLGLTGTVEEVAAAADAYRVYSRKADDDPRFYLVDHSTYSYLMAPEAGFLEVFGSDASPQDIAAAVGCFSAEL